MYLKKFSTSILNNFLKINILIFLIYIFIYIYLYVHSIWTLKPWPLPLQVVVDLRRGQFFLSPATKKITIHYSSISCNSSLNVSGTTTLNGATTCISSFNVSGITTLNNKTIINGIANIHGGNPRAIPNNHMQSGSLTIGDKNLNYGGGSNWNTNTSGLLLECLNDTEIAVHDSSTRIASFMYYEGGENNKITIGRNMGYGAIDSVAINGNIVGNGTAISNLNYNAITKKPDLSGYATNSNLNSLSTNSTLNISYLNATSTTIFNNLNSLSTNSILNINKLIQHQQQYLVI